MLAMVQVFLLFSRSPRESTTISANSVAVLSKRQKDIICSLQSMLLCIGFYCVCV